MIIPSDQILWGMKGILLLVGGVLLLTLIFGLNPYASCTESNNAFHLAETISMIALIYPIFYSSYYTQSWYAVITLFLLFGSSSFFHICNQMDQLNCPSECILPLTTVFYLDFTSAFNLLGSIGFYGIVHMTKTYHLVQQLFILLCPMTLGTIYSTESVANSLTPETSVTGTANLTILILTILLAIFIVGFLIFRYQRHPISFIHSRNPRLLPTLITWMMEGMVAILAYGLQGTLAYQYTHLVWHILGSFAIGDFMVFIDLQEEEQEIQSNEKKQQYQIRRKHYHIVQT